MIGNLTSYLDFLYFFFGDIFSWCGQVLSVRYFGSPVWTYLLFVQVVGFVVGFIMSHSPLISGGLISVVSAAKSESRIRDIVSKKQKRSKGS